MSAPNPHDATDAPLAAARSRVGMLVDGRWRVDTLLAIGGSSAIYTATHRNGMRVAMKVLDRDLRDNGTAVAHFVREGLAVNGIGHPGVVPVLDEGRTPDGSPFLLMPLLEGETAQQRLARHPGGLPPREALGIVEAVLDVLAAAHDAGVVHRDLKPDNIFLERAGAVRVLDFGIARMSRAQDSLELTMAGTVVGTAGFLPPEQARGRVNDVGPRSDLFAVGATLLTLLTGRVLHEAPHLLESIVRAQSERVPPARQLLPGVSRAVAQVLDGALAFEPASRWTDARAMGCAVRVALDELRSSEGAGSCAGVAVESLPAAGSPSDAPVAIGPALAPADEAPRTRVWAVVVAVAAAAVLAAVAVRGTHKASARSPIVLASPPPAVVAAPPPPSASTSLAPPVEKLAPLPPADRAAPSASAAPRHAPRGPSKAREIIRDPAF
jgi:hypothetical protein